MWRAELLLVFYACGNRFSICQTTRVTSSKYVCAVGEFRVDSFLFYSLPNQVDCCWNILILSAWTNVGALKNDLEWVEDSLNLFSLRLGGCK